MPIHDFRCDACGQSFERLVRGDATPACPHCASPSLQRLVSRPSPPGTSGALAAAGRRAAAREGHFSHYSRAERVKAK